LGEFLISLVRVFFGWAIIATWGIGLIGLIAARTVPGLQFSTNSPFYLAAGYATSLAGVAMTAVYDGRSGQPIRAAAVLWR
jgi:hypothetical protein